MKRILTWNKEERGRKKKERQSQGKGKIENEWRE